METSPVPPPPPTPSPNALPLPAEINSATRYEPGPEVTAAATADALTLCTSYRSIHTQLNRLITSRLPLALPPHTTSPALYAHGLRHFALVYYAFEAQWTRLCAPRGAADMLSDHTLHAQDIRAFLAGLLPPGLMRSERLRDDLSALSDDIRVMEDTAPYPGKAVQAFAAHIEDAVSTRNYVLVAYAWVMYMAIFSGGRWIRAQLLSASSCSCSACSSSSSEPTNNSGTFWPLPPRSTSENISQQPQHEERNEGEPDHPPGLSFLHFPGPCDGKDVKAAFKQRLEAAEPLFSADERREIVAEARRIFGYCIDIVAELDEQASSAAGTPRAEEAADVDADAKALVGVRVAKGRVDAPGPRQLDASRASKPEPKTKTTTKTKRDACTTILTAAAAVAAAVGCASWYAFSASTFTPFTPFPCLTPRGRPRRESLASPLGYQMPETASRYVPFDVCGSHGFWLLASGFWLLASGFWLLAPAFRLPPFASHGSVTSASPPSICTRTPHTTPSPSPSPSAAHPGTRSPPRPSPPEPPPLASPPEAAHVENPSLFLLDTKCQTQRL
ncbi:hypothetical protein LTR60_001760, partial [Cryomyces antarcticus]